MLRIPLLACLLCLTAHANAQGTISDGDAAFTRGPDPWGPALEADFTGVSPTLAADHLRQLGWAFRVEGDVAETFLPPPDNTSYFENESHAEWIDLAGRGLLTVVEDVLLLDTDGEGGASPGGEVIMQLSLRNFDDAPLTLSVFHLIDPNIGDTPANDTAQLLTPISEPTIRVSDPNGDVGYYKGEDVDAFLVVPRGSNDIEARLADSDIDDFDDSGLPASGDLMAGFQWMNRTLAPGDTLVVRVRVAINRPVLAGNLSIDMADTPDPVVRNQLLGYDIKVSNLSAALAASRPTIDFDVLPDGVTFVETEGCTNDPVGYPACTLGPIDAGQSAVARLWVRPGADSSDNITMAARVRDLDAIDTDLTDNATTEATEIVEPRPDLSVLKTNNRNSVAADIDGWVWQLALGNRTTATANAVFAAGDVLLIDQLPSQDVVYGIPVLGFPGDEENPDVDGTAMCTLAGFDLVCTATSAMTFEPGTHIEVSVPVLPQALQLYVNPRANGQCLADPGNAVAEQDENNNSCSDAVLAVDFMLFSDGFEE